MTDNPTDTQTMELEANKLSSLIYSTVQSHGPPTNLNIGISLAALAHVVALVLTTNENNTAPDLALFMALLGQELITNIQQDQQAATLNQKH